MKISAVQTNIQNSYYKSLSCKNNTQQEHQKNEQIAFKGNGGGALIGLGTGLITSLAILGGGVIAGFLAIPAILGSTISIATGAAFAAAGDKIEDKIIGHKNKEKQQS